MAQVFGLGTTMPGPNGQFSSQQIGSFQADDRAAGRAVILLMTFVFSLGLVGSSIIAFVCWQ